MLTNLSQNCDLYWTECDWLPPWYVLDRWCQGDDDCKRAKLHALLSACERKVLAYRRSDSKPFDDPVRELFHRDILMIGRESFNAWCTQIEGRSPLDNDARRHTPTPVTPLPNQRRTPMPWDPPSTQDTRPNDDVIEIPPQSKPDPALTATPSAINANSTGTAKLDMQPPSSESTDHGVPSDEIITVFQMHDQHQNNVDWWSERLSNAPRYKLAHARTKAGKRSHGNQHFPSLWDPHLVAGWLVEKNHMRHEDAQRILNHKFPEFAKPIPSKTSPTVSTENRPPSTVWDSWKKPPPLT